ncbi:MAG: sigma-70 family RNA polymerase sigma factor [Patescibacteria group bacterium]
MPTTELHPSDAELIEAYGHGDERSFELLVNRHLPAVYRFLLRMTADPHTAEDLTQETFLKAWRHLNRFDRSKSFSTWLFTIGKNTVLDFFKKKRAIPFSEIDAGNPDDTDGFESSLADLSPLPSDLAERAELGKRLEALLATLPPAQRMAIVLHETEGLTFREVADILGEPLDTVKSRHRRGMIALRTEIERLNSQKNSST